MDHDRESVDVGGFEAAAHEIAGATGVDIPTGHYYRHGITACWNCKNHILVFAWPDERVGPEGEPFAVPRPQTIKCTHSTWVGGSYWGNVCPCCGRLQGDHFMYSEPDGPFFSLHDIRDTPDSYAADMGEIASWYAQNQLEVQPRPADSLAAAMEPEASPQAVLEMSPQRVAVEKLGTCVHCGMLTADWWSYDGRTQQCKCRPCRERGLE